MTTRDARETSAPRLGETFGWRQVNGWEKLRRIIGRIPNAIPHVLVIRVRTSNTGDVTTEHLGTGSVLVPAECEFYCLATAVAGHYSSLAGVVDGALPALSNFPVTDPEGYTGKVLIQYESGGFRWSNAPVRIGHMFGSGDRPYVWPAPWIIPGGTTIQAQVRSRQPFTPVGKLVDHFFSFIGFKRFNTDPPLPTDFLLTPRILDVVRRARLAKGGVRVEPYVYALNFDALGNIPSTFGPRVPHGVEQQTFSVSEADFAIVEQMGMIENLDLGVTFVETSPTTTVKLTLDVGRRRVDDRAQPVNSIFGSARRPFRYAYPLVITRGGNLTAFVEFGKSSLVTGFNRPENGYLTFSGVRIFPEGFR